MFALLREHGIGTVPVAELAASLDLGRLVGVLATVLSGVARLTGNVVFLLSVMLFLTIELLEGGWSRLVLVIVIYVVVNFVLCSLVRPRYIGDALGLSLTVVFLSLGFWAWMLGPLGAVLAVPLTLLAKAVLVDADPGASWVWTLLGARATAPDGVAAAPLVAVNEPPEA